MNKTEKIAAVEELKDKFSSNNFFYLTDSSQLPVDQINALRRVCFEKDIEMKVIKNTLAIKALESIEDTDYSELYEALKGPTAVMFTNVANAPARVIKEFRGKDGERPIVKAAYIDSSVYIGDDKLKALAALKSKEELIGEIITLLQSPAKNVISSLKSSGSTLMGILKTLEAKGGA